MEIVTIGDEKQVLIDLLVSLDLMLYSRYCLL